MALFVIIQFLDIFNNTSNNSQLRIEIVFEQQFDITVSSPTSLPGTSWIIGENRVYANSIRVI